MVQTRILGRITKCVLQSGNIASSFKAMRWRDRGERVTPQTVANIIVPVGWHQGHRWTEVEIDVLGEITEVLGSGTPIIVASGDNLVMTSCALEFTNHLGSTMIVFVKSPVVDYVDTPISDYEPTITTIHLKAYYVTQPALK